MKGNPEGGELDLAVDDRRPCQKNSPSVLSCIDKRAKTKSEQFTVSETRTGQAGKFAFSLFTKVTFWRAGFFPANQSFFNTF